MDTLTLPLLHDRHSHLSLYAALAGCPSVTALSKAQALAQWRDLPKDQLTVFAGWHNGKLPLAPEDLADLPPLFLVSWSLHGYRMSPAAHAGLLRGAQAGTALGQMQAAMVAHEFDQVWIESHLVDVLGVIGTLAGLTPHKLTTFLARMASEGLGAVDDLLVPDGATLDILKASSVGHEVACWMRPEAYRQLCPAQREQVAGLKVFLDGALGSRTAALSLGYRDQAGQGMLTYTNAALQGHLLTCHAMHQSLAIHAIGDRAIDQALDALDTLAQEGLFFPGVRFEHAQFITLPQARRMKARGFSLGMQPNFSSESLDYADRLCDAALAANNPFRMLIDEAGFVPGQDLLLGSDGMPHGIVPALQWGCFPPYPQQRLTVEECVAGYGASERPGQVKITLDQEKKQVTLR